jgi:TPR repeat protein
MNGTDGLPLDCKKGFELILKGAELGLPEAHNAIGNGYWMGKGVEVDIKKAKHHFEMAAIGGHVIAMYNLGAIEYNAGNNARAKKHWMAAASAGYDRALGLMQEAVMKGYASKDEYERALQAHKDSTDEMKSEQRDAAQAYLAARDYIERND